MPLGLIQNKGPNLIYTEFVFPRLRSLNRVLNKASPAWYCALGHAAMLYSSEQTG